MKARLLLSTIVGLTVAIGGCSDSQSEDIAKLDLTKPRGLPDGSSPQMKKPMKKAPASIPGRRDPGSS